MLIAIRNQLIRIVEWGFIAVVVTPLAVLGSELTGLQ